MPQRPSHVRMLRRGLIVGAALAVASGVLPPVSGANAAPSPPPLPSQTSQASTRQQAYVQAAREYAVPRDILLAVSYLESRWESHAGQPSRAGGYGPMHLTDVAAANAGTNKNTGTTTNPNAPTNASELRGDPSRPGALMMPRRMPNLQTIDLAAKLTGIDKATLRTDAVANIRGGAAILADYHRQVLRTSVTDGAAWYAAVARYSGAPDRATAQAFADEAYSIMRDGLRRTTSEGHVVSLPAGTRRIERAGLAKLGLTEASAGDVECPERLGCEWIPAPYQDLGNGDYGNHDLANRPTSQRIRYIIIHDTEGSYAGTIASVQDPTYVSWQYTLRASDGHVAQHVKAKDVAWQAGNWYVNAKSIGLEHEGYAARGTWYTEAMYRSSAKLVRYLAGKYAIPLDRQHILGHDNVQAPTPGLVEDMHWDPGPYWDWAHYFELLGKPFERTGTPVSGAVTIRPAFARNNPGFTNCEGNPGPPGEGTRPPCGEWGSSALMLRTEPRAGAPLLRDVGSNPPDGTSTMDVADIGSRVSTGQQYAVAEVRGDWTAVWYLGQKGWFFNPRRAPTALWATTVVATPKPGRDSIQVYGRAYPEAAAYPEDVPPQALVPLQYTLPAGQEYVVGMKADAEYYRAVTLDPSNHRVIRGALTYYQIQFGHRIAYVLADDVDLKPSWR
ncbi:N-acetylmuramoyl-L-alanine amidase [Actinopolymorpha alba]|uniref:N-acetylmuramoyl-L-alanine amidase n=1 Tax=Actinopolymorpha alba TaxID=533267 RepID=UPI001ED9A69E|nr:peptidoglycan recognition family protein [Actinopolymorpha alba]